MPLVRAVANRVVGTVLVIFGVMCMVTAVGQYAQGQKLASQQHALADQQQKLAEQRRASAVFIHCTAEWQADFLRAFKARSAANLSVTDAMDGIVKAVNDNDPAAFNAAVKHYQAVRDKQIEERVRHPLPPLPAVRCGK